MVSFKFLIYSSPIPSSNSKIHIVVPLIAGTQLVTHHDDSTDKARAKPFLGGIFISFVKMPCIYSTPTKRIFQNCVFPNLGKDSTYHEQLAGAIYWDRPSFTWVRVVYSTTYEVCETCVSFMGYGLAQLLDSTSSRQDRSRSVEKQI